MTFTRSLVAASLGVVILGTYTLVTHKANAESRAAFHATVNIDGKTIPVTSDANRVSDLLDHVGVVVHPGDKIEPALTSNTSDGMSITLHRKHTRWQVVRTVVPIQTVYKNSPRLLPGRQLEVIAGRAGIREEHYRVTSVGDQVIRKVCTGRGWARKPEQAVVLVGHSPFNVSRGAESIRRSLDMRASEYDVYLRDTGGGGRGTGFTATGVRARRGIVAVDPRVIPLGTHLYVEGYGYCVAADTGGAIKGRRIDLCVESPGEANAYGMHNVTVYILD